MSAKQNVFVYDTETTGLPHQQARTVIVQIAGYVIDINKEGWPVIPGSSFVRFLQIPPGASLGPFAMNMHRKHGRNQAFFKTNGDAPAATYEELYDHLRLFMNKDADGKDQKVMPCGHNAGPFDVPLLLREAYRYGVDLGDVLDHHIIDTAGMATDRYGALGTGELASVSLRKLAPFLGVEFDDAKAHDAGYDRDITAACLRKMKGV